MPKVSRKNSRGFTFVELLAVVLVLAVLAAVAIPMYMNSRRSAAARTCTANIGTISRAVAAYATRNGAYPANLGALVGQPEGLENTNAITCPLRNATSTYTVTPGATGCTIQCPNAGLHQTATGGTTTDPWIRVLPPIPTEPAGL